MGERGKARRVYPPGVGRIMFIGTDRHTGTLVGVVRSSGSVRNPWRENNKLHAHAHARNKTYAQYDARSEVAYVSYDTDT